MLKISDSDCGTNCHLTPRYMQLFGRIFCLKQIGILMRLALNKVDGNEHNSKLFLQAILFI